MSGRYIQPKLLNVPDKYSFPKALDENALRQEDRAFHDWYRFVLSFPPHLVRHYLAEFGATDNTVVLDPFCGTGTTIVESQLQGVRAIGIEANPFPHFASQVKTDWCVEPVELLKVAHEVAENALNELFTQGIDDRLQTAVVDVELRTLSAEATKALIKDSISPLPLHKVLILLDHLNMRQAERPYQHGLLALGKALVESIGNLRFGPEVGVGTVKQDTSVVAAWLANVRRMAADLQLLDNHHYPRATVYLSDSRQVSTLLPPNSVDIVITSPPYPNEKDYTRTTRLESVVLGFYTDMQQLRSFKRTLVRSNTRGVYKSDEDWRWIADHAEIQHIANTIEQRRKELGKTSGFEKLYGQVTRLYFGGMARHLSELRTVLRPGAKLAYVVGDQASFFQVLIRTGQLLADIAERQGYAVDKIDLFRTRFATATQEELREEVVILTWPG
jgi:hypothetical protein